MKKIDLTNVQEAGDFQRPSAGAYICEIKSVEDITDKEYLKVTFDIVEGEFAGYYTKTREEHPDWAWMGQYCRSYKDKALGMFKRFCSAVSKSNGNFIFDGNTVNSDERTLAGKRVGIVLQEEEYYGNDGNKKVKLVVNKEFPVSEIAMQRVPKRKEIHDDAEIANAGTSADEVEIPFLAENK